MYDEEEPREKKRGGRRGRHGRGSPGKKRTTHCEPGSEQATLG